MRFFALLISANIYYSSKHCTPCLFYQFHCYFGKKKSGLKFSQRNKVLASNNCDYQGYCHGINITVGLKTKLLPGNLWPWKNELTLRSLIKTEDVIIKLTNTNT